MHPIYGQRARTCHTNNLHQRVLLSSRTNIDLLKLETTSMSRAMPRSIMPHATCEEEYEARIALMRVQPMVSSCIAGARLMGDRKPG